MKGDSAVKKEHVLYQTRPGGNIAFSDASRPTEQMFAHL